MPVRGPGNISPRSPKTLAICGSHYDCLALNHIELCIYLSDYLLLDIRHHSRLSALSTLIDKLTVCCKLLQVS